MNKTLYTYKAKVVKIVDGDTVKFDVDLGFRIHFTDNFRLMNINAPEIRGIERPEGLKSKAFLIETIPIGTEVIIESYKHGKYRWLCEIFLDGVNINNLMVEEGFAVFKKY